MTEKQLEGKRMAPFSSKLLEIILRSDYTINDVLTECSKDMSSKRQSERERFLCICCVAFELVDPESIKLLMSLILELAVNHEKREPCDYRDVEFEFERLVSMYKSEPIERLDKTISNICRSLINLRVNGDVYLSSDRKQWFLALFADLNTRFVSYAGGDRPSSPPAHLLELLSKARSELATSVEHVENVSRNKEKKDRDCLIDIACEMGKNL